MTSHAESLRDSPAEENLALLTFRELVQQAHAVGLRSEEASLYSLAWFAMAREQLRNDPKSDLTGLLSESRSALPKEWFLDAREQILAARIDSHAAATLRMRAEELLAHLAQTLEPSRWSVVDWGWGTPGHQRSSWMAPELCELIIDLAAIEQGSRVWVPFDPHDQISVRVIRRGATPSGPRDRGADLAHRLVLAVEGIDESSGSLSKRASVDAPSSDRSFDALVGLPPMGVRFSEFDNYWRLDPRSRPGVREFNRVETWAVARLWPQVRSRAVFLVSPSFLFAKGQEARVREELVMESGNLDCVVTVPPKVVQDSSIAPALLVLDRREQQDTVRLIDASDMCVASEPRSLSVIDAPGVARLYRNEDSGPAIDVKRPAIAENEFNLVPSRYLRSDSVDRTSWHTLGDLVVVVRPPALSKGASAAAVREIGISNLERWQPISWFDGRDTYVRPDGLNRAALQPGDLVVSIKGTIGKAGLVGAPSAGDDATPRPKLVVSQSCVALRPITNLISSEWLFLFLRSETFWRQVQVLRVGAVIGHVTPSSLLSQIRLPKVSREQEQQHLQRYRELCELEIEVEQKQSALQSLARVASEQIAGSSG